MFSEAAQRQNRDDFKKYFRVLERISIITHTYMIIPRKLIKLTIVATYCETDDLALSIGVISKYGRTKVK